MFGMQDNNLLKRWIAITLSVLMVLVSETQSTASINIEVPPGVYVEQDVDLSLPHVDAGKLKRNIDMTACNNLYAAATPIGFAWSGEYRWLACSYWGYNAVAKKHYNWYVSPHSSSLACAQGFGYRSGSLPYWDSIGCGAGGSKALDWGMVIAYPKLKVKSISGLIVPIYWN